jgi:hypothetical protein
MSNNFNVFYAGLIKLIFNSVKLLAWQLITSNFFAQMFLFYLFLFVLYVWYVWCTYPRQHVKLLA